MPNIVFVAPFYLETTLRFAAAVGALPNVRLGVVSQQPLEALPEPLRRVTSDHWRLDDPLNADDLTGAVAGLGERLGGVDRLLGILEQLQESLAEVRRRLEIPGMAPETARRFRDKALMKATLQKADVPCARFRLVRSADEAREFAAETGFPLVGKPPAGAGAKSTFRVGSTAELEEALAVYRPSAAAPILFEEFLSGSEQSFDSVTVGGEVVWHSGTRYLPSPLEVLRHPWIQWCVLLPREREEEADREIRELGPRALRALGLEHGFSHMEWFRRDDGSVAISEVAARPPGAHISDLISYAHDADFFALWAQLMVFDRWDPLERPYAAGAAYLRGQGRGRIADVEGLEQAQSSLGELVVYARLPRRGQPTADGYEGEGVVIVRHPETRVVEEALRELVSTLRVRLE